jgi:hypothetical protein
MKNNLGIHQPRRADGLSCESAVALFSGRQPDGSWDNEMIRDSRGVFAHDPRPVPSIR